MLLEGALGTPHSSRGRSPDTDTDAMTAGPGPSTGDATLRRRIEPWEFESFFDPRVLRRETCLLYEIQWGRSQKLWRSSGRNTTNHVEVNFIGKLTSERHFQPAIGCSVTWFLSWSPCWECCKAIGEFLSQHPNVKLVIYVARLFHHTDERNRQGLRDLINSGVTIQIMTAVEYCHCWKNFVNYPPGEEAHWPRFAPQWMSLYALELHCIILSLPPCLMISRRYQNQLTLFQLTLQSCHYQVIPAHILLAAGLIPAAVTWR
ncbi:C-_U-editing enzyme APOBEC-1 [Tupaia chinensis]|uniref:C->U-editing enzyme APOBEC-1 n=1 Tax=Tupaia chinensis TaxID=246437 RepID=UPI000FFBE9AA|nr:C->U-editing enzyme APOBEC-1 [Tupaia chinensis]